MIELPFLLISGVLGSAHCLGMCGGFALSLASCSTNWRQNLGRQAAYSAGRIFTYTVLGAFAGFGGARLATWAAAWTSIPALLAFAAGLLLIVQGAIILDLPRLFRTASLSRIAGLGRSAAAGQTSLAHCNAAAESPAVYTISPSAPKTAAARPSEKASRSGPPCLSGMFLATFLTSPGLSPALLAGAFTGFLPCGLLYGMLALAASTRSMPLGAATMAVFGLGTVPAMVLAGCGGGFLSVAMRRKVFAAAAICLMITGGVSLVRGAAFLMPAEKPAEACPFCR